MNQQDAFLNHIELTEMERKSLSTLPHTPGYAALLKLMHGEVLKAETEHFQHYKNPIEFDRTGQLAVAMRLFMERIEKEITFQTEAVIEESEFDTLERVRAVAAKDSSFRSIVEAVQPSS